MGGCLRDVLWGFVAGLGLLSACTGALPEDSGAGEDTDSVAAPAALSVVTFNVEGGDASLSPVSSVVGAAGPIDLWAFQEVPDATWAAGLAAAGGDLSHQLGTTGREMRLVLAWNPDRVVVRGSYELEAINVGGSVRAPLVAEVEIVENGVRALVVVNHLWRSDTNRRHTQARLLNQWAADQVLPVIMVGDHNFDWRVQGGDTDHDAGYDLLTAEGALEWVRPDPLIRTQCSGFDSVLDFVFVGGEAKDWGGTSEILQPQGSYCPDSPYGSDHRPVKAVFGVPG